MAGVADLAVLGLILTPFAGLAMVGLWLTRKTYQARRTADAVQTAETKDVGRLEAGEGLVGVSGTVRSVEDDLVSADLLETEGVAVHTDVYEAGAGRNDPESYYLREDHVPFVVDDGTGEIPVDPPDVGPVELEYSPFEFDTEDVVGDADQLPPHVAEWVEAHEPVLDGTPGPWATFEQGVIEDGEEVYALGEPVVDDDGRVVLTGETRPKDFVVGPFSQEALASSVWATPLGYVIGGGVFLFGAAPVLIVLAGVVS